MKDWVARHLVLTREERLLVGAIVLIVLVGLGVRWHRARDTGNPLPPSSTTESGDEESGLNIF